MAEVVAEVAASMAMSVILVVDLWEGCFVV